jgi:hypothetical protein
MLTFMPICLCSDDDFFCSELPTAPPEIGGGARNYAYGDDLNLNCTSKPSYPPTRLTWSEIETVSRDITGVIQKEANNFCKNLSIRCIQ